MNRGIQSKLLVLEKQFIDEKRRRIDADTKLASQAAAGPADYKEAYGFKGDNSGQGDANELKRAIHQLTEVQLRVQRSLQGGQ